MHGGIPQYNQTHCYIPQLNDFLKSLTDFWNIYGEI